MSEEEETNKGADNTEEDSGDGDKPETHKLIADANTAAERLEKANQKQEELISRQEEIIERERLEREGEVPVAAPTAEPGVLPPEQLPPVIEQVEAEEGIFKRILDFISEKKLKEEFEEAGIEFAEGVLPLGPGGAIKLAASVGKIATSARAIKVWKGFRAFIKTNMAKNIGKYGTIGFGLATERSLSNIDSALSQVRESLTLPVSLAAANPNRIGDAWDMLEDYELDIREYEQLVQQKKWFTPSAIFAGRTRPIFQRIKKLDAALLVAREQIAKIEALGRPLTDEETVFALAEINKILDIMEEPSKFLGII